LRQWLTTSRGSPATLLLYNFFKKKMTWLN
jgi:hypothetical protein